MAASSQRHCRRCGRFVGNPREWCRREPCNSFQESADAMAERWRQGKPNGWDLYLLNRFGGGQWAFSRIS